MARVLEGVARRLGDNYPYFHPLYAGQMLKPPHPVARAAYALAMTINPNNHARDGGRASSEMEIEAVREIAGMFGWTEFLGHLTSSGTWPIWKRSGWPGNWRRANALWARSRRTIRTSASPPC
jgi:tyrosine decarboxylase / aspartate 1-decarboxylase